jgi:hypothetical protein
MKKQQNMLAGAGNKGKNSDLEKSGQNVQIINDMHLTVLLVISLRLFLCNNFVLFLYNSGGIAQHILS